MSLRLILGRAGSGKTRLCLREITERLQAEPEGPPLIYIVPEQGAFQAEYALATTPGLGGIIRAQVLSFRRLAWKVMQESGGGQHLYIDDTGKGMLLRKVLEKKKRQLKVFKNAGELQGALENIVSIYNELKRSRTASGELEKVLEMLGEGEGPALLREKIGDLLLLFQDMDAILKGRYFDAEDYLSALAEKAFTSEFLSAAEVWVDGFYGFTNQEYAVLGALMKRCLRLSVTLCIEQEYVPGVGVDELDPFHPAAVSCQRLMKEAEEQEVEVEDSVVLTGERFSAEVHPALAFLEKNLYNYSLKAGDKKDDGSKEQRLPLRLVAAANRREEVEALACELIRLARDEGYRWREFAVIVGDLEHYRDIIATVFNDYGIPFFLDQKRQVLQHPLVEFIRSALEVVNGYWRYEALFRCIKTGFLLPFAAALEQRQRWEERVFLLENYVLAFGIQGSRWLQEEMWCYRLSDSLEGEEREITKDEEEYLQMIDETRRVISRPLLGFQERVKKAQTVKEKTEALYTLLLDIQAAERLEYWSEEAVKRGEPEKAREHLQVYKGLIELMDQLVEILGEEKLSLPIYTRILESGLESMRLSLVPPSLDQVLVGNVERTRTGRVKYAFLLGVNDGILPARPPEDRLFSEEERELLAEQGVEMAPGSKRRLLDEQFLLYMALTRASHGLWISYPLADEEGG
ncbi:MAG: helicase-exonuclease AddAB subunit AddB, partial [Firmicutes bacterium]|nr:helicase-exonuclease AddAB subunit AddB [Bacillota bacterium]